MFSWYVNKFISDKNGTICKKIRGFGPQVRFNLGKIKEEADKVNPGLPVEVIDMKDYGMMNGEKVYAHAKKLMGA